MVGQLHEVLKLLFFIFRLHEQGFNVDLGEALLEGLLVVHHHTGDVNSVEDVHGLCVVLAVVLPPEVHVVEGDGDGPPARLPQQHVLLHLGQLLLHHPHLPRGVAAAGLGDDVDACRGKFVVAEYQGLDFDEGPAVVVGLVGDVGDRAGDLEDILGLDHPLRDGESDEQLHKAPHVGQGKFHN